MLLFAHAGLTLAGAAAAGALFRRRCPPITGEDARPSEVGKGFPWLTRRLDIRLLFVASLLPDIIDKPIGHFFFAETFNSGRLYAHSLLFALVLGLAGYALYRGRRQIWLLVLALGSLLHLLLDLMWQYPATFLWPLYGWGFPKGEGGDWVGGLFYSLLHKPEVYIPEMAGLAVLLWFLAVLWRRGKVFAFIWRGQV